MTLSKYNMSDFTQNDSIINYTGRLFKKYWCTTRLMMYKKHLLTEQKVKQGQWQIIAEEFHKHVTLTFMVIIHFNFRFYPICFFWEKNRSLSLITFMIFFDNFLKIIPAVWAVEILTFRCPHILFKYYLKYNVISFSKF